MPPAPFPRRALIEELEPRLLFSADFAPGIVDALAPQAEQRLIGSNGEFANAADSQQAQHARLEVVFIDLRVQDYDKILADIQAQNTDGHSIEVVLLDSERDGVVQVGEFLSQRQDVDAIHLISHGSAGSVQLGAGELNFDSLLTNASTIKQWGNALSGEADILIYGCDLASTAEGQSLVNALTQLTGADVAASDDKTGTAELGGDWELEYRVGAIDTATLSDAKTTAWAGVLGFTPLGTETRANQTTTGDQTTGYTSGNQVASDSAGNFVVIWADANSGDVYARLFDSAGAARGNEFRVNTTTTNSQFDTAVAMDAAGNFVAVWTSASQDGSGNGVYAQRFNASGVAQGGEFRVNQTTASDQGKPSVAMDGLGNFIIAWTSTNQDAATTEGVYARRYNAAGNPLSGEFAVNTYTANNQTMSGVAADAAGNFIVVWESWNQDGSGSGVYGQRYDASGVAQGVEFRINTTTADNQVSPEVAYDAAGNFVVVWGSNLQDGTQYGIYAQRFSAAGVAQGAEFRVNTTTAGNQDISGVAMDAYGNFIVVWESAVQDGNSYGVYARQFSATGTALTGETLINTTTMGGQAYPSIAWSSNQAVIVWSGNGTGDTIGTFFRLASTTVPAASAPVITSNGGGASASVSTAENQTAVTTVTATDADSPTLIYSISGGADAAKFTINASTGVLTFVTAPDFEAPTDAGANNIYNVTVRVSDGVNADTQDLAVTVTDVSNTLVVTTTSDAANGNTSSIEALNASNGGDGVSLREAIIAANNTAGTDTITFNIAGTGVHTINVASALPTIAGTVTLDATTDDSYAANGNRPAIVLNGGGAITDGLRLWTGSDGSTIRGLVIQNFTEDGIDISGSGGNTIAGNWIGLNAAGTGTAGNQQGVNIWNSNNNIIGGSTAADRNVISANSGSGISINTDNGTGTGNQIRGNYIGTNAAGTAAVGNGNQGVYLNAANNTIGGTVAGYGNVISGTVNWAGIGLGTQASNTLIAGNLIGTNAAGTAALGNNGGGITVQSANNTIGGTTAAARNIISGNNHYGFEVLGATSQNNLLLGNYIGTDVTGLVALGNTNGGVSFWGAGTGNAFGGSTTGARNVIAGNTGNGVLVGSASTGATIQGNYIGIGADGATALGNGGPGISVEGGSTGTLIGTNLDGTNDAAERNVIAGNAGSGIVVDGAATTGTLIRGNWIGLDVAGNARGNAYAGVFLSTSASNNTVGGSAAGAGNTIAYNGWDGIRNSGAGTGNAFLGNSLYDNAEQGIDIGVQGITANDPGDADTGGNNLQNFPVLYGAAVSGSTITVTGEINSTANTTFRIEFFNNPLGSEDASGYGEGKVYLGFATVTTDGSGNATINTVLTGVSVTANDRVSSTATVDLGGSYGSTSEFSQNVIVIAPNQAPSGSNGTITATEDQDYTFTTANFGFTDADGDALMRVWFDTLPASGTLKWNGTAFAAGNWVDAADITSGLLTYTPATNVNGTGIASFTFRVQDDGGTLGGGVDTDPTANTLTINVASVNDAPTDIVFDSEASAQSTVNAYGTSDQIDPSIAAFSDGGYIVVWASNGQDGSNYGIYGQRFNADGTKNGVEFLVTSEVSDAETNPSVVTFSDGGFVVAWQDQTSGVMAWTEARAFNADGTAATAEFKVSPGIDGNNEGYQPAVVALDSNRFVVVWTNESGGTTYEVAGRIYDRTGAALGAQFSIGSLLSGTGLFGAQPEVTRLDDGGFAVVWRTHDGTNLGVSARVMNADGTARSAQLVLSGNNVADIASLSNGGFVVTYDAAGALKATVFNASGSIIVPEFTVNTTTSAARYESTVTRSDDGFVVAWESSTGDGSGSAILTQRFDASGNKIGGEIVVNQTTAGNQQKPEIIATSAGKVVAVWQSENVDAALTGIVLRACATNTATIAENATNGTRVADAIGVFDLDAGDTHTYSLIDSAGGRFAINSSTGVITVANAALLDYETSTTHTLVVRVTDSGGLTYDESLTINVANVNDAPAGTNKTVTTLEDTAYTFTTADFGFSDVDGNALLAVKITTLPGAGSLTWFNGTADIAVTAGQTISATDITSGRLKFTPAANANGTGYASFTFQVQDNGGTANGGVDLDQSANTITVNVSAVNDAPTDLSSGIELNVNGGNDAYLYTTSTAPALTAVTVEVAFAIDSISSNSTPLYSYAASSSNELYLDITASGQIGFIQGGFQSTSAPPTPQVFDGQLHHIAASWDSASGNVTIYLDGQLIHTATIGGTDIDAGGTIVIGQDQDSTLGGFATNQVFHGTIYDVRLWDIVRSDTEIALSYQQKFDSGTLPTGLIANWQMDGFNGVNEVVDIVGGNNLSIGHASGTGFVASTPVDDLRVNENAGTGTKVGYVMPSDPDTSSDVYTFSLLNDAGGRFAIDASTGELTVADGSLLDYETATSHTITVRVTDSIGGTYDEVMTVSVDNLEEPSQTVPGPQVVNEDTVLTFSSGNGNAVSVTDTVATLDSLLQVRLSVNDGVLALSGVSGITFVEGTNGSSTFVINGTETDINAALEGMTFTPDPDFSGSVTLNMTASLGVDMEGHYTFDGGNALDQSAGTSHDGVLNGTATTIMDSTRGEVLSLDGTATSNVSITGLMGTPADITVAAWVNLSTADTNGAEVISLGDAFGLRLDDSANGGGLRGFFYTGSGYKTVNYQETLAGSGWHHVALSFDDTAGTLILYLDGVQVAQTETTQSIAYSRYSDTYIGKHANPDAQNYDFNGQIDDVRVYTRALSAQEIKALANNLTENSDSLAITVNPVNDAPDGTDKTVTTLEDTAYTFTTADFGFTDVDGNTLLAVKISTLPGAGSLTLNGVAVTSGQTISAADITSGLLMFTPAANANGTSYASFTFQVQDNGGTANGGVDLDPTPNTITVNVTAVNDMPTVTTGGGISIAEDSSGTMNLTIGDPDLGAGQLQVTMSVAHGSFSLAATAGLAFTVGDGTADAAMTFTGTLANVNAALATITYTPTANYVGADTLLYSISDQGNSPGPAQIHNGGLGITVTAVNDAPNATITPTSYSATEQVALTLHGTGLSIADIDASTAGVQATLSVTSGILTAGAGTTGVTVSGSGSANITLSGTLTQINSLLAGASGGTLTYTANSDAPPASATLTLTANDLGNTGSGGAKTGSDTATINITAVNDAPVISVSGTGAVAAGGVYTLNLSATDADGAVTISSWTINWGDGQIETVAGNPSSVTHTYAEELGGMSFNISVAATDADGTWFSNRLYVPTWSGTDAVHIYQGQAGTFMGTMAPLSDGLDDHIEVIQGPNGNLFVSSEQSDSVLEYTTAGALVRTFVAPGSGGLNGSAGMAFGPDGNLYVASYHGSQVLRYDGSTGAFLGVAVAAGTGGFGTPLGLNFGSDGMLYVTSRANNSIMRFDAETGAHDASFSSSPVGNLEDFTFGPDGNIYVADGDRIVRLNGSTGALIDTFVAAGAGGLSYAAGLTFGPDGRLYVADQNADAIRIYHGTTGVSLGDYVAAGGGGLNSPAYITFAASHQVAVAQAVNDQPAFSGLDGTPSYTEGSSSVVLDSNVQIYDAELSAADNFNGATLTLVRNGGANAQDVFSATGTLSSISAASGNVVVGGTTIGTYTHGSGTLVFTFNANATNTLVNSAMQQIAYANSSDTPPASAQINWHFSDGNSGSQGTGGALSATGSTTVTIIATNDAPVITPIAPDLTFIEGGLPQLIDATGTITDADSTDFEGGTLIVSITANGSADDRLMVGNWGTGPGQVGVSGSNVTYEGTVIGTVSGGTSGDPLFVSFNTSASAAAVQEVYRSIQFDNLSDAPSTATREIYIELSDGDGGVADPRIKLVYVQAVNDAPVITTVAPDVTFVEGGMPQVIDALGTVSDVDSPDFDGGVLMVSITQNASAADRLVVGNFGTGTGQVGVAGSNVTYGGVVIGTFSGGSSGADPLVVTFNSSATLAAVQEVRASIQFDNVSDTPSTLTRQITFALTDGDGGTATPQNKLVYVQASNDAPVITSDGGGATASVNVAENQTAVTTVTSTDVDSGAPIYSIVGGADAALFSIDASTGVLTFNAAPNYEAPADAGADNVYDVTVQASDGTLTDTQAIAVTVTNANESPVLNSALLAVSEGQTVSLSGVNFGITDPDSASFTYTVSGISGGYFQLSTNAGVAITTFTSADLSGGLVQFVDDGNELAPAFSVTVNDGSDDSNTLAATITYTPVNDAPVVNTASLTLSEGQTVTLTGANFGITDPDSSAFTYTVSGVTGGYFQLSSNAGVAITSFSSADLSGGLVQFVDDGNEVAPAFSITVNDGSDDSNTLAASVTYTPVNDAPVVNTASLTLNEGQTVTLSGANFGVTDPDSASFTCTVSGISGGYFQLSSAAGVAITSFTSAQLSGGLVQFVDDGNEVAPAFSVTVNDGSDDSNTLAATVTYTPVNDAPATTPVTLAPIAEDSGARLITQAELLANATDIDSPALTATSLAIASGSGTLVDNGNGTWTYTPAANDDTAVSFSYTVTDGSLTAAGSASLDITPVNDAPTAADTTVNATEDTLYSGTLPIATDIDGDAVTYALSGAATHGTAAVNADGSFTYNPNANFNGGDSFTYTVSDGNGGSNTYTVSVNVAPVNDAPVANADSAAGNEDTAIGGNVLANDTDVDSASLTATLVSGPANGALVLNADGSFTYTPDADWHGSDSFTYTANDSTDDSNVATVTITVNPVNDAPTVTPIDLGSINEDGSLLITQAMLLAGANDVDGDALTAINLSLTSGSGTLTDNLDDTWTFTPTADWNGSVAFGFAVDDGTTTTPNTASLAVNAVNDAPVITSNGGGNNAAISLAENIVAVTTVTRTDVDGGAPVYGLSGTDAALFTIDSATGALTFIAAPDFEAPADSNGDNVYEVTVEVSDGAGGADSQALTVTVTDVDEYDVGAIVDTDATLNAVDENAANGTVVGITAFASDADATTNGITYSLDNDAGGRFAIDAATGVVTVADGSLLDRESAAAHGIVVRATSADGSTITQAYTITLNDVDEFDVAPIVDTDAAANQVSENAVAGTAVSLTAFASDADATTNGITYSLDDDAGGRFAIDAATGVVTVNAALDYEAAASHGIVVRATSADGSFATQGFTISVSDTNESGVTAIGDTDANADFVFENAANGTTAGLTAFADDADGTDSVSYSLDDDAGGRFTIDGSTGVVTVAGAIDREAAGVYSITVRATSTDTSTTTRTFDITIGDVDEFDVSPVVDTDTAANQVNENAVIGTVVGITAFASDADATTNGITYSLTDNDGGRFTIDASTGVVTVAGAIDREADGTTRNITVRATSADGSFDEQVFSIGINDVDEFDVGPVVDMDAAANQVSENAANGTVVGITAFASDADATTNGITYSLDNDAGGRFTIDATTGVVTVADGSLLDYEAATSHAITLRATSSDGSYSTLTLSINVAPVNDNAPAITSDGGGAATALNVAENTTAVTTVTASDADLPAQTLTYAIAGGADAGLFSIDGSTGALRFSVPPDFEAPADAGLDNVYEVIVQVSDGVFSDAQTLSVTVTPVNDNAPVITTNTLSLLEGETVVLNSSNLNSGDIEQSPSQLNYTVSNVAHGQFEWAAIPGAAITGFTQADINAGLVVFVHDASDFAPAYDVTVSDGPLTTGPQAAMINFTSVDEGINITNLSGTDTTESDGMVTFDVTLNSQPFADVTVFIVSGNVAEGTVSVSSLTFTAANWSVAQQVSVIGENEFIDDGDQAYVIELQPAVSADRNYDALDAGDVALTNQDNDTAGITMAPTTGLVTDESGASDTFSVVLTSQPLANVVIDLSSSNTDEGTLSASSLTFTSGNWNIPQLVTVTGVNDAPNDGDIAYQAIAAPAASADSNYNGLAAGAVDVTNLDVAEPVAVVQPVETAPPEPEPQPQPDDEAGAPESPADEQVDATPAAEGNDPGLPLAETAGTGEFARTNPVEAALNNGLKTSAQLLVNNESVHREVLTHPETQGGILLRVLEILRVEHTLADGNNHSLGSAIKVEITQDDNFQVEILSQGAQITAVSLSVGAVWWALRAGGLFTSLLTSLPAWRSFDVLPVLSRDEDDDDASWNFGHEPEDDDKNDDTRMPELTP